MSGSINQAIIIGPVGQAPEARVMQNGRRVVTLSVATSERWTDKASGEKREKTEWHRVVIFNEHLAGIAEKYVCKGDKIYLEGALQTRKWTDQSGQDRYTTEIVLGNYSGVLVMLSARASGSGVPETEGVGSEAPKEPELDESIPF